MLIMNAKIAFWFSIFVFINCFAYLQSVKTWSDKQIYPANKIPEDDYSTRRSVVRRKIVYYHNFFRTKVRPTASNMLLMTWSTLAARQAQDYAERCVFLQHNNASVPYLGRCGQNIFVSTGKTSWFSAIKDWFLESKNFVYGVPTRNPKVKVGHYTQMVWATSHKVGCGVAYCSGGPWGSFYNYVCNYSPAGNVEPNSQYPYKIGPACGDCPQSCMSNSLCTNSCPMKDLYSNCKDLVRVTNICTQDTCNATCTCGDQKLYRNYPW